MSLNFHYSTKMSYLLLHFQDGEVIFENASFKVNKEVTNDFSMLYELSDVFAKFIFFILAT